ncbi:hypothetical protein [Streptomyces sp.]|uniref:hypothetical protein n=1 Tax=Streptomyces sp. TaxID=1931 RepID=UPI002D79DA09|nr:hypothetical protein [Streptomyces sp.]HET6357606.1 hypothetical protein [Streptomyces sp.]
MRTTTEAAIREVVQALDSGDFTTALSTARAAYRTATDEETRSELLLYLGPRAASEPHDQ